MYIKKYNFSLWCDFVERGFLKEEFLELTREGKINGATSNPAIFKSAILTSPLYKEDIKSLKGSDPKKIYEQIACKDIQIAADILKPLYDKNDDGYISIEIDPTLCDNAKESIEEGKRLFKTIGRDNVMIKVPATQAGYEIAEELIAEGINVNVTLIFSPMQTKLTLEAIEKAHKRVKDNNFPDVVISVFVSRFDRKLDDILSQKNIKTGLTGIYNASKIYNLIRSKNIPNVRTLFASTGVKGGDLPQDYYIKELLYENSINTAPLKTIKEFMKNREVYVKKPLSDDIIDEYFKVLQYQNIDIKKVYDELMDEGLKAFKIAFSEILDELR